MHRPQNLLVYQLIMVESSARCQEYGVPKILAKDDRVTGPPTATDQATDQWRLLQGTLAPDETITLAVQSGSMLPLLPVGATIEIAPCAGNRCQRGEIVVFRQQRRLVAHRLLFGWGDGPGGWFLQRGDGTSPAGFIRPGAILGRVVAVTAADGVRHDLRTAAARDDGLRRARGSLARLARDTLKALLGRKHHGQ
jgi:hypothetical protein